MKIITKGFATRCEICHKSDFFDAENEVCARCTDVNLPQTKQVKTTIKQSSLGLNKQQAIELYSVTGIITFVLTSISYLVLSSIPNSFEPFTIKSILLNATFISLYGGVYGLANFFITSPFLRVTGLRFIKIKGVISGALLGFALGVFHNSLSLFCGNSTEEEIKLITLFWLVTPTLVGLVSGNLTGKFIQSKTNT